MTDGKLVRDLLPAIIRKAGRHADVRYLSGEELVSALGEKLYEEAQEAAEAIQSRERLIEELADITEVMSALMAVRGIGEREVFEAARAKAKHRGRFDSGALLKSAIPKSIRRYRVADVDAQWNKWIPEQWIIAFSGHESAHADLKAHSEEAGGIARSFIHARAQGNPVDLFLIVMAWGYGPTGYGPSRTSAILAQDGAEEKIGAIVDATRNEGAAAGWDALSNKQKIKGLGMSFGTKLLYFAGYSAEHRPRPLILDERVRSSLQKIAPGTVPAKGRVLQADYLRYLDLADEWASDPTWQQTPEVVEYALWAIGGD